MLYYYAIVELRHLTPFVIFVKLSDNLTYYTECLLVMM